MGSLRSTVFPGTTYERPPGERAGDLLDGVLVGTESQPFVGLGRLPEREFVLSRLVFDRANGARHR